MTDKQIRDRIVGALSVSMMSLDTEAECIRFLDRCITASEQIQAMTDAMKSLCRSSTGVCEYCEHYKALPVEACEAADCDCDRCEDKCACAACKDGSGFEWRSDGGRV